jgi:hypothetical protein
MPTGRWNCTQGSCERERKSFLAEAEALLASPTCQRNGPGSTRCSAFLRNNRTLCQWWSPCQETELLR